MKGKKEKVLQNKERGYSVRLRHNITYTQVVEIKRKPLIKQF